MGNDGRFVRFELVGFGLVLVLVLALVGVVILIVR
jgi:hypothetical protein